MEDKIKILFLCTGNSCRSQMAEAWARTLKKDSIQAYSAGIEAHGLDPHAVRVMAEAGVDMADQQSTHLDEFRDIDFDLVVTVCDHANETCPWFPSKAGKVHRGFDDPPKLAASLARKGGDAQAQLDCYRRVRDEIRDYVEGLPEILE